MSKNKVFFIIFIFAIYINSITLYLPIDVENRRVLKKEYITIAGDFGIWRKSYNSIPAHYHSGIDLKNPSSDNQLEPIFACANGRVISVYNNNASSFVIIEHKTNNSSIYTVYTHIRDIVVSISDTVNQYTVIGRFMSNEELDKWGEYLNHLHFEILKQKPKFIGYRKGDSIFASYSINCKTRDQLFTIFYNPILFFIYK